MERIARQTEHKYPHLFNYADRELLFPLCEKIVTLKKPADYFYLFLVNTDKELGDFYIFLGTFFVPLVSDRFKNEVDPANFPFETENIQELRVTQLHKLNKILQSIDPGQRKYLYEAVTNISWLMQFCALPFTGFLAQFKNRKGTPLTCTFGAAANYVDKFAQILCNGRPLQPELFEALYLYKNHRDFQETKESETDRGVTDFILKATDQIKTIKNFMTDVPLEAMGMLIHDSLDWTPAPPENTEQWFSLFEDAWHRLFDRKWNVWLADRKRELTRKQLKASFALSSVPLLPYRPWVGGSGSVNFRYDCALGFLLYFFKTSFPGYMRVVEQMLMEGEFPHREFRSQVTDIVHALVNQERRMDALVKTLAPMGDLGITFAEMRVSVAPVSKKFAATMQGIETEAAGILKIFLNNTQALLEMAGKISKNLEEGESAKEIMISTQSDKQLLQRLQEIAQGLSSANRLLEQLTDLDVDPNDKPFDDYENT
jgi:hypothetical protein